MLKHTAKRSLNRITKGLIVSAACIAVSVPVMGAAAASAQDSARPTNFQRGGGSIYRDYGNAVFARGAIVFAAHSSDADFDVGAIGSSFGFRRQIARNGRMVWSIQPNVVWQRESSELDVVGVPVDQAFWGLSGLISGRLEYQTSFITPFVEAGVGPGFFETVVDDGVTKTTNGNLAAAYSGVAGFEKRVTDRIAIEAAYRYLGALREQAIGFHSGEVGVSYRF